MSSRRSVSIVDAFRPGPARHRGERGRRPGDVLGRVVEVEAEPAAGRWVEAERTVRQARAVTARAGLDAVPVQAVRENVRADAGDGEGDQRGPELGGPRTEDGEAVDLAERPERLGGERPGGTADAGHRLLAGMAV